MTHADESAPSFPIEGPRRLSQSLLWKLLRRYFDKAGIGAWRTTTVPHHVTNNPSLAHAYAQVFLGFLRSFRSEDPVTIVELGAGSGRLAYLFLRAFSALRRRSAAAANGRVRYVLSDFTETNVRYFREHARLRPFVDQGLLDFALLDATEERFDLHLLESGVTLGAGVGPICVIANYLFDSIPQDAFLFEGGQILECLISLSAREPASDLEDPALIGNLTTAYERRPAKLPYYGDADLDTILADRARALDGEAILFPCTTIRCLRRFADLADGRLLVLSGDYEAGQSKAERGLVPGLALHGNSCFSMPVDQASIGAWIRRRGGLALQPAHRHAHLIVTAFILGDQGSETRLAYEQAVERAGPDDLYALDHGIRGGLTQMGLPAVLSLLRLSHEDPRLFGDCLPALWGYLDAAPERLKRDVVEMIVRVWDNYYPIGEEVDLAFELGLLAHAYGGHREALGLFRASIGLYGDDPKARWNMALCHWELGETESALRSFADAARLDPAWKPAGALQVKTQPEAAQPVEPSDGS